MELFKTNEDIHGMSLKTIKNISQTIYFMRVFNTYYPRSTWKNDKWNKCGAILEIKLHQFPHECDEAYEIQYCASIVELSINRILTLQKLDTFPQMCTTSMK